jgi:ubiquinone/menaquinone biosynthesis C-methylase UbiE
MTEIPEIPEHVRINRAAWTKANADYNDAAAEANWAQDVITWGVWGTPESELRALPEVRGKDVIELGCGTAYFGAWLKKSGARRVVGIDVTPAQLETARRLNAAYSLGIELIEANAESIPLEDAQFDLAISEYGASIWCDPFRWIPEAARLLRTGGQLVFMRNSTISMLCAPDTGNVQQSLQRPQKGLNRLEWTDDDPGVEFHLGTSDMLHAVQQSGFELVDFIEIFAPETAEDHPRYDFVPSEWAKRWPSEEIWRLRKSIP